MIRISKSCWILSIALSFLIISTSIFQDNMPSFSQVNGFDDATNNTKTWTSKRDNLNITMNLDPSIPIIDEKTQITFSVKKLNDTGTFDDLNARVTITDHDGRLFKFGSKPIAEGKVSVDYIFPDDGQHRAILQIYKNSTAFALASFDITVPHPQPPSNNILSWLFQGRPF
jgi:hypothetical protein